MCFTILYNNLRAFSSVYVVKKINNIVIKIKRSRWGYKESCIYEGYSRSSP
jgi:hypothetical protein